MATRLGKVGFRVYVKDATKEGLDSVKTNVKTAATEAGGAMSQLVPEKTGKALTRLNEKTEKARQLMTAFGGEVGQVAGTVTFYGGTIASVVGGFNKFELGAIAAVGAVVSLGFALYKMATGPLDDAIKKLDEAKKSADEMISSWDSAVTATLDAALGLDKWGQEARKLRADKRELEDSVRKVTVEMDKMVTAAGDLGIVSAEVVKTSTAYKKLNADLADAKFRISDINHELSTGITTIRAVEAAERKKNEAARSADKAREDRSRKWQAFQKSQDAANLKALQAGAALDEKITKDQEAARLKDFIEGQKFDAAIIKSQNDREAAVAGNLENWLALKEQLEEAAFTRRVAITNRLAAYDARMAAEALRRTEANERRKREAIKRSLQFAATVSDQAVQMADMFDLFGVASAKSEEERAKAEGKRLAVVNAIKAATEIAESVAAYARLDPLGGTLHALAATLYGAAAVKAGMAAGGGAAAGGAAAGAASERTRFREGEAPGTAERATEAARGVVVINVYGHQVFGSDSGRFFDREIESYRSHQYPGAESERF